METGDTALKLQVDYLPCTRIGLSIDHSPQLRHISIAKVLISGAGFLADAYDLFVINIAVDIMALCAYKQPLTTELISTVKSTAIAGAIVGQIFFGSLADLIGRKKVFVVTCFLIIAGAILSGLAVDSQHFGIYSQVALWRFVLGVGIGGEYPLSAAITTESSSKGKEIRNLAMVSSLAILPLVHTTLI